MGRKRKQRRIVRNCSVCGHLMNIFIGKTGHYSKKIGFFGDAPIDYAGTKTTEYWECAICFGTCKCAHCDTLVPNGKNYECGCITSDDEEKYCNYLCFCSKECHDHVTAREAKELR